MTDKKPRVNERGSAIERRLDAMGVGRRDFAEHAGIDRTTLYRALSDDKFENVGERTWVKIESALDALEDELGMAATGKVVTTTIEYGGARITVHGPPEEAAETVRLILGATGE